MYLSLYLRSSVYLLIHLQCYNVENFYLYLFEISNTVLEFEKSLSCRSENLFQIWTPRSGAMCKYSTLSHDKLEYTHMAPLLRVHVWNKFSDKIKNFRFRLNFQISKLDLGFQKNSNGFSSNRSFGHKCISNWDSLQCGPIINNNLIHNRVIQSTLGLPLQLCIWYLVTRQSN